MQQTFLGAWTALRAGADVRDPRAWLFRIAHNAALNTARQARHGHDELQESLPSTDDVPAELERRLTIRSVFARLGTMPERQRDALVRTTFAGDSRAEIAHDLALSEGAVRQLVHRGRATVRRAAAAITPLPLLSWSMRAGAPSAPISGRIAELTSCGDSTGLCAGLAKAATVAVAATVLAGGSGALHRAGTDRPEAGRTAKSAVSAGVDLRGHPLAVVPTRTRESPRRHIGSGHGPASSGQSGAARKSPSPSASPDGGSDGVSHPPRNGLGRGGGGNRSDGAPLERDISSTPDSGPSSDSGERGTSTTESGPSSSGESSGSGSGGSDSGGPGDGAEPASPDDPPH